MRFSLLLLLTLGSCVHPPRCPAHECCAPQASPAVEVFRWRNGEPPVRMLRTSEGHCFLSGLSGSFEGGGEGVEIYAEEGWWWLHGHSKQRYLEATATGIRYAGSRAR